jgi:hypothetical protein
LIALLLEAQDFLEPLRSLLEKTYEVIVDIDTERQRDVAQLFAEDYSRKKINPDTRAEE